MATTESESQEQKEVEVKDLVLIAKQECLKCTYLVGSVGAKKYPCIKETYCPANYYHITIGSGVGAYTTKLVALMKKPNMEEMANLVKEFDEMNPQVVEAIYQHAREILNNG